MSRTAHRPSPSHPRRTGNWHFSKPPQMAAVRAALPPAAHRTYPFGGGQGNVRRSCAPGLGCHRTGYAFDGSTLVRTAGPEPHVGTAWGSTTSVTNLAGRDHETPATQPQPCRTVHRGGLERRRAGPRGERPGRGPGVAFTLRPHFGGALARRIPTPHAGSTPDHRRIHPTTWSSCRAGRHRDCRDFASQGSAGPHHTRRAWRRAPPHRLVPKGHRLGTSLLTDQGHLHPGRRRPARLDCRDTAQECGPVRPRAG